jgi:hypothetical protein
MQQTTYRIWLQPGVKRLPPGGWGRTKEVSSHWFAADGVDVTVAGDGSELDRYLNSRRDLFNSWGPPPSESTGK